MKNSKTIKITTSDLQKMIKEGVNALHKKTIIEGRIKEINEELGMMQESDEPLSSDEIFEASNNPYGASMFFITNFGNILNQDEAIELADLNDTVEYVVSYDINWEDGSMHTESGKIIPSAYGVNTEVTDDEEFIQEKKYSDKASEFIGKEISHLVKDKGYDQDRAVAASLNIARDKGYKIPKKLDEGQAGEWLKSFFGGSVSDEQKKYNKENNLPDNWNGTKEGYHEFLTKKKSNKGSN